MKLHVDNGRIVTDEGQTFATLETDILGLNAAQARAKAVCDTWNGSTGSPQVPNISALVQALSDAHRVNAEMAGLLLTTLSGIGEVAKGIGSTFTAIADQGHNGCEISKKLMEVAQRIAEYAPSAPATLAAEGTQVT